MKLRVSKGLKKVEYFALGTEVGKTAAGARDKELLIASVPEPVLMRDPARLAALESPLRDAVFNLLDFPGQIVEFDGVSTYWSPELYPGAWSPSIDTMLFAEAIRLDLASNGRLRKIRDFLEIGTGSGFLSKYLLVKKRASGGEIRLAHLSDINKDALRCALDNLEEVRGRTLMYYTHTQRDAGLKVDRPYDLVLSNPPYIPRPGAGRHNPYEGLFLYTEMIRNAARMLRPDGVFMTILSSLSRPLIEPALKKVFSLRPVLSRRVPLKIPAITAGLSKGSRDWIGYLRSRGYVEEDRTGRSGHRYWQTIEIVSGGLKRTQAPAAKPKSR